MSEPERLQVSTDAAEVYESCFVPAIFGSWAGPVADTAGIRAGDRVLDEPRVEWRRGDAASLPFEDACFEAVVSQFALMYFPDRVSSLREMWRTLAPAGRLAVAAWAAIDRARGYEILVEVAARRCGREAADVLAAPFVLGDRDELAALFVSGGIPSAEVRLHEGSVRFSSVHEFVRVEVQGSPLAEMVRDDVMQALAAESEEALAEFVEPSGEIVMPIDAHIVTASKAES